MKTLLLCAGILIPPAVYDHAPLQPVTVENVPWYHVAKVCGYTDPPPTIPMLSENGGAELTYLNRPSACSFWRGQWYVVLPVGGGWSEEERACLLRHEHGHINGWRHGGDE